MAFSTKSGAAAIAGLPERLNPHYPFYYLLYVGQARFVMRRIEEAAQIILRSIARNPEALPKHYLRSH